MTQAIELGTVLGGRYKVTAQVLTTAARDQVLEGRDQVLGRQVSILAAGPQHAELLIDNARSLASGPRSRSLQILDLGQSEDTTYLITSHTDSEELLDLLLPGGADPDDGGEALGSEIFGTEDAPAGAEDGYEAVTGPVDESRAEEREQDGPAVTRWTDADYESFGEEPPAQRSGRSSRSGGTLFDRAASDAAGGAAASAASRRAADAGYDGSGVGDADDDRAYDYGYDEAEPAYAGPTSPDPATGTYPGAETVADEDPEDEDLYPDDEEEYDDEPRRRGPGGGLWITALVVILLLAGLVFFGFTRLGAMVSSIGGGSSSAPASSASSGGSEASGTGSSSASASASPTEDDGAEPRAVSAQRIVPGNASFMADQDGTLSQVVDGNPSTVWTSYGFSSAQFGSLISGFGIAVQLQDPAKVSQVTVDQQGGTGGSFTVYTSDSPSLDGATEAGKGTFDAAQTTVRLNEQASSKTARYVIVFVDSAPRLSQPIGGYPYGLRLGEISVR